MKSQTPLAIIGIGCLFPKADGLKSYWANIREKVDCITEVPESHWKPEQYFHTDQKVPDMTYGKRGGFLSPTEFDCSEFGITPNNISATDPAQLLSLVAARAALDDAGYDKKPFDRKRVSVILGVTGTLEIAIPLGARLGHPHWRRALKEHGIEGERAESIIRSIADSYVGWQENSFPGLLGNVVAGRIANRLDLGGTNCVVDAACASSLSAAHLASMELETGRADMVVTGGVDTFNDVFMFMCFSKTPALSPTGNSRPFDAEGDGTILGEGIGMVVLKRLADAERDGDRIYAVLKGIGSSSDGKGKAIYAPSPEGQVQALKRAYEAAGISPATIDLVEAHGTGTKAGDAAELKSLTTVYREAKAEGTWAALGSVKSQLGHTKAAAGSAGLIKAVMALHHKTLPPTIKIRQPLPDLASGATPFYANTEKRPWLAPEGYPRRAAMSAFGFGGSNFHAVLEEYGSEKREIDWDGSIQVFAFSSETLEGLKERIAALSPSPYPLPGGEREIRVKAFESRRDFSAAHSFRLAAVVEKGADTAKFFQNVLGSLEKNAGRTSWSTPEGVFFASGKAAGKVGFLFSGQGSQYVGMGRDLACAFPQMLESLERAGRELADRIYPYPAFDDAARAKQEEELRATMVAQPAIGTIALGMAEVLGAFGVKPQAAAGHSYGELAALCAAGVYGPEELQRLSRLRGELMAAGGGDKGTMLAVIAPLADIEKAVAEEKLDVVIANKNAPKQSVLSGGRSAIAKAAEALARRGMKATPIPVAAAFHSALVADARKPFRAALSKVDFKKPAIPVYANTTAAPYPADPEKMRDLLGRQLAAPVEFVAEIERMYTDGVRTFVEVGPGNRMTGLVKAILDGKEFDAVAVDGSNGKRHGVTDLARALAQLAAAGCQVDLEIWENGEEGVRDVLTRKKPKVSVSVSGATPVGPAARGQKPELIKKFEPVVKEVRVDVPAPAAPSQVSPTPNHQSPAPALMQGLAALQKIQEQTAQLHKQFLEGQEATQRALHDLILNQATLLPRAAREKVAEGRMRDGEKPLAASPLPETPKRNTDSLPPSRALRAPSPAVAEEGNAVEKILLAVVSEKTGYPAETLNLDMGMESDLGIDSIKRVEILSAMREKLPGAPVVGPQHIGTLRTLRQVIEFLSAGLSDAKTQDAQTPDAKTPPAGSSLAASNVEFALLAVVAEKTGYPAETLNLDMGMEADLGIDSIKRVEILSAIREKLPGAPVVGPQHIGTLRTLRQVIEFLCNPSPAEAGEVARRAGEGMKESPKSTLVLKRSTLKAVPFSGNRNSIELAKKAAVWVTDDGSAVSRIITDNLNAAGYKAKLATTKELKAPAGLAGLIVISPKTNAEPALKDAFLFAKAAGAELRKNRGVFLTVSRLDGAFGLNAVTPEMDPVSGGLAGLSKTACREWEGVSCRALDVAAAMADEDAAAAIVEEVGLAGPLEMGISTDGRVTVEMVERPFSSPSPLPSPQGGEGVFSAGDVVVVTGGARGVTAECAVALAKAYRPTMVLFGRTPGPEGEPEWAAGLTAESEIKRAIVSRLNGKVSPKAIEEEYRRLMTDREVLRNLKRIEEAGSRVEHRSVDLTDAKAVSAAVAGVRKDLGLIKGLVHGAGVLADKVIEEKNSTQFDSVFDTKVAGLRNVLQAVNAEELRFVALFSSVSGRYGRRGQCDYAMANEVLNKTAQGMARMLPSCRVISIGWGPWDGGMVNASLKKVFEAEGVAVIPLEQGGEYLVREIAEPAGAPAEVVVEATLIPSPLRLRSGQASPLPALRGEDEGEGMKENSFSLAFERTIDVATHPFLESHVIGGKPVLPMAVTGEWLAHGAMVQNPGMHFHGFEDMRVFKGVVLESGVAVVQILVGGPVRDGERMTVPVEMRGTDGILHAGAKVVLGSARASFNGTPLAPVKGKFKKTVEQAYEDVLFHGPRMQTIGSVDACAADGITAQTKASPAPKAWMKEPLRSSWLTDPAAVDAAFQMMILWTHERYGAVSLPCYAREYRQFRAFPKTGVSITACVTQSSEARAVADIEFSDAQGVVARLDGYECTINPGLTEAFKKNLVTA